MVNETEVLQAQVRFLKDELIRVEKKESEDEIYFRTRIKELEKVNEVLARENVMLLNRHINLIKMAHRFEKVIHEYIEYCQNSVQPGLKSKPFKSLKYRTRPLRAVVLEIENSYKRVLKERKNLKKVHMLC